MRPVRAARGSSNTSRAHAPTGSGQRSARRRCSAAACGPRPAGGASVVLAARKRGRGVGEERTQGAGARAAETRRAPTRLSAVRRRAPAVRPHGAQHGMVPAQRAARDARARPQTAGSGIAGARPPNPASPSRGAALRERARRAGARTGPCAGACACAGAGARVRSRGPSHMPRAGKKPRARDRLPATHRGRQRKDGEGGELHGEEEERLGSGKQDGPAPPAETRASIGTRGHAAQGTTRHGAQTTAQRMRQQVAAMTPQAQSSGNSGAWSSKEAPPAPSSSRRCAACRPAMYR